jgi:hypothetical protein
MDPLGLAFEHFDAIGAYRATDQGAALDVHGDLDGVAFEGAIGLGSALRADPRVSRCLTRQLFRWATGHLELEGEGPALERIDEAFAAGGRRFLALAAAIALSDAFRAAGPPR